MSIVLASLISMVSFDAVNGMVRIYLSAIHPEYYTEAATIYIWELSVSAGSPSTRTLTHTTDITT